VCVTVGSSGCTVGFSFVGVMCNAGMCRCKAGNV